MRCLALGHGSGLFFVSLLFICPPSALLAQSSAPQGGSEASAEQAGTAGEAASETAPASAEQAEKLRARELRAGNTYYGSVGGIFVPDAGSGAPKSFRLQLMSDFFGKKDFLYPDDQNRYIGSALSLGISPIRYLEISAAVTTRNNRNSRTTPEVLQAVGDLHFGVKSWGEPVDGLTLGGEARLSVLSALNRVGTDSAATTVGLRGNLSIDLRKLRDLDVPLQLRLSGGYVFNNSNKLIESTERARLANLGEQSGVEIDPRNEYRHLARRDERFALGIDRVDHAPIALGMEVPLAPSTRFAIHPIAEWGIDIPVNRQDFDCPYVTDPDGDKVGGTDSCLGREGIDTLRQRVTLGARVYPVLPGLNLLAAVDIGVGGSTNFVQELAPNAPYRVILAASYTADLQPKPPVVREVEKRVEVPMPPPPAGHVQGRVIEQGDPLVIANARVEFPGRPLNPLLTHADGTFVTQAFEPGPVQLAIEAEGYRPGTCSTAIPEAGGDVEVTCELEALPRVGTLSGRIVDGSSAAPVADVSALLTGPSMRTLSADAQGQLHAEDLMPGEYTLRVEREGYLISVTPLSIKPREETAITVQLSPMPANPSVRLSRDRLQVRGAIGFATGSAEIEPQNEPLLAQVADLLMRHPELLHVEVQGHTDDGRTPEESATLSQARADAVKAGLVRAGVERDRLTARGYGMDKPLVPNLTPQNRARNRRVEFAIVQRAGE